MPELGGYDNTPINIVGPVRGWLDRRRARQEENNKKVSDHAQFVERVAVLHQSNLEMLNQAHVNDLERIKAKSNARRGLVRDAGKIVGTMPTDSTLKVGKVELTRTAPANPAPAPRTKAATAKAPTSKAPTNPEAAKGAAAKPKTPTKAAAKPATKPAAKEPAKPATAKPPAKPRTKKPQA